MNSSLSEELASPAHWLEPKSRNTAENAAFSAVLLKEQKIERILLVTHAWHMPRAYGAFNHEGLKVTPAPTVFEAPEHVERNINHFLPSAHALSKSQFALHEYLGQFWYWLKR